MRQRRKSFGQATTLKVDLSSFVLPTLPRLLATLFAVFGSVSNGVSGFKDSMSTQASSFRSSGFKFPVKKYLPLAILVVVVLGIIVWGAMILTRNLTAKPADSRVSVLGAKAATRINKEFKFPIKDASGKEVTKVKYLVDTVELRDEIIVKGQRAEAVKGKTFLIVTIKITNDYTRAIDFSARDFMRLTVNNSKDLLAADIHNDPVDAQPISSKTTRLGFPISDTDKNLVLHVGELTGDKTDIPVRF